MTINHDVSQTGICATPCPHGLSLNQRPVMVGSMLCTLCRYNFGCDKNGKLRCTGNRMREEAGT